MKKKIRCLVLLSTFVLSLNLFNGCSVTCEEKLSIQRNEYSTDECSTALGKVAIVTVNKTMKMKELLQEKNLLNKSRSAMQNASLSTNVINLSRSIAKICA